MVKRFLLEPSKPLRPGGFARARGGLSARDFVKVIAFQRVSRRGARALARTGEAIAEMEGMQEHKKSILLRRQGK